jgi:hypothetical protein
MHDADDLGVVVTHGNFDQRREAGTILHQINVKVEAVNDPPAEVHDELSS